MKSMNITIPAVEEVAVVVSAAADETEVFDLNGGLTQTHSSAGTSLPKNINGFYRRLPEGGDGKIIIDYGCGRGHLMEDLARSKGYSWYGCDLNWRTPVENKKAIEMMANAQYVICANVLNVVPGEEVINHIVKTIWSIAPNGCEVVFAIYEKDKTGIGCETNPDCWQRNMRYRDYIPYISKYFTNYTAKGGEIRCVR